MNITITITITNPTVNVLAALAGAHAADNAKMMESLDKASTALDVLLDEIARAKTQPETAPVQDDGLTAEQVTAAQYDPAQELLRSLAAAAGTLPAELQAAARTAFESALQATRLGTSLTLPGPTGESNCYRLLPRGPVWALPATPLGLAHQVAAALATGNPCHVVLPEPDAGCAALWQALQAAAGTAGARWLQHADDVTLDDAGSPIAALLFEGDGDALLQVGARVAARKGAIVRIESRASDALQAGPGYDLAALLHEQSISTNTAAAGGNAQLMTMA